MVYYEKLTSHAYDDYGVSRWINHQVAEIPDGKHTISYAGAEVPVTVLGEDLTIHVKEARGKLEQAKFTRLEADADTVTDAKHAGIKDITFSANPEEKAVFIQILPDPFPGEIPECHVGWSPQLPELGLER